MRSKFKGVEMIFVKKKDLWETELQKIEKQEERFLNKRADKKETHLNQFLSEKIPGKVQETLNTAFAKAFTLIFEKGTGVIEKTYNRENMEKNFEINRYAAKLKESKKELRAFSKNASDSGIKNIVLSAVSGIGMGALGVGLPDIPVFTAILLKSIYEIALSYGFAYESEEERYFILLLIQGAVSYGDEMIAVNDQANVYIETGKLPDNYIQSEMIGQTARCLSKELLYMKFLQGIPIAGVIGGVHDVVYTKRIVEYAKLKYSRRFFENGKEVQ